MNYKSPQTLQGKESGQLLFFVAVFASFGLLKWWYQSATVDDLHFLLAPVSRLIIWITGSDVVYLFDEGYLLLTSNVLIDKSCSGFNFWMITAISLLIISWPFIKNRLQTILVFPIAYIIAYLATLLINTSRIISILMIQTITQIDSPILHRAEGILIYVTGLISVVLMYRWTIEKIAGFQASLT